MKIQILAFIAIAVFIAVTSVSAQTGPFPQNQSLTLSMTVITSTCGLNVTSNSINLGVIIAGYPTSAQSVTIANPGNTQGSTEIRGSNWQGINTNQTLPVGITSWQQGYVTNPSNTLAAVFQSIGLLNPGQSIGLSFKATSPSQTISDSFTQQVILTITC